MPFPTDRPAEGDAPSQAPDAPGPVLMADDEDMAQLARVIDLDLPPEVTEWLARQAAKPKSPQCEHERKDDTPACLLSAMAAMAAARSVADLDAARDLAAGALPGVPGPC